MKHNLIGERITALRATLPQGVTLIAVSKYHPAEAVLAAENAKIVDLCKNKMEAGIDREKLYGIITKYAGKNNPNAISTLEESQACYKEIDDLKK